MPGPVGACTAPTAEDPRPCRLARVTGGAPRPCPVRQRAWRSASQLSGQHVTDSSVLQRELGVHLLEPAVLCLALAGNQPGGVGQSRVLGHDALGDAESAGDRFMRHPPVQLVSQYVLDHAYVHVSPTAILEPVRDRHDGASR
jgi:hypothetical protein